MLLSEDNARDPLALADTMAAERVTAVLSLLPTLLRALLEDKWQVGSGTGSVAAA